MSFTFVWDYIKALFDAPFSSTVNGLSIVGLSIAAFIVLWVLCGFAGAIRDICGDLMKKISSRSGNREATTDDDG